MRIRSRLQRLDTHPFCAPITNASTRWRFSRDRQLSLIDRSSLVRAFPFELSPFPSR